MTIRKWFTIHTLILEEKKKTQRIKKHTKQRERSQKRFPKTFQKISKHKRSKKKILNFQKILPGKKKKQKK